MPCSLIIGLQWFYPGLGLNVVLVVILLGAESQNVWYLEQNCNGGVCMLEVSEAREGDGTGTSCRTCRGTKNMLCFSYIYKTPVQQRYFGLIVRGI
jgi:hypothetical protein